MWTVSHTPTAAQPSSGPTAPVTPWWATRFTLVWLGVWMATLVPIQLALPDQLFADRPRAPGARLRHRQRRRRRGGRDHAPGVRGALRPHPQPLRAASHVGAGGRRRVRRRPAPDRSADRRRRADRLLGAGLARQQHDGRRAHRRRGRRGARAAAWPDLRRHLRTAGDRDRRGPRGRHRPVGRRALRLPRRRAGRAVAAVPDRAPGRTGRSRQGRSACAPWSRDSGSTPRANPDFAWAFGGRLLVNVGNALGTTYFLFFLRDFLKVPDPDASLLHDVAGLPRLHAHGHRRWRGPLRPQRAAARLRRGGGRAPGTGRAS